MKNVTLVVFTKVFEVQLTNATFLKGFIKCTRMKYDCEACKNILEIKKKDDWLEVIIIILVMTQFFV